MQTTREQRVSMSEQSGAPAALQADMDLDNSHTIEITMRSLSIRIKNDVDPALLTRTFRLLQDLTCQAIYPGWKRSISSAASRICVKSDQLT